MRKSAFEAAYITNKHIKAIRSISVLCNTAIKKTKRTVSRGRPLRYRDEIIT